MSQDLPAPQTIVITSADGRRLVADVAGPPNGIPVVLAHGTGQSRYSWRATVQALAERGFRAFSYDLRGHGESDRAGDYGIDRHGEDLRAVLERAEAPAVVVGASLGGVAGLCVLGAETDRPVARALVMIDIGHRFARAGSSRIDGFMQNTVGGFDSLADAQAAVAVYLPHRTPRADGDGLLKTLIQRDDGRFYWRWDPAMLSGRKSQADLDGMSEGLAAHLRRVAIPLLVIRGTRSEILSRETAQEMLTLVQDGRLVEVEGAHHMVAGDDNNAFMAALLGFIDTLER